MYSRGELEAERLDRLERERLRQTCQSTRMRLSHGPSTGSATSPLVRHDEPPAAEAHTLLFLLAERLDRLESHVLALEQWQRVQGRRGRSRLGRLTAAVLLIVVSAASTLAFLGWVHRSTPAATTPDWSEAVTDDHS